MSVASVPNLAPSPAPAPRRWDSSDIRTFSVDEYHKMIAAGVLTEDDPVELLEGWIKFKMPHNPRHDGTVKLIEALLGRLLPAGWHTRTQSAITTADSEPEPDVAVVAGDPRRYLQAHPGPRDIALVVEVADSSLARDRDEKLRIYASASIPTYLIVNLVNSVVEVYTSPSGPEAQPAYGRKELGALSGAIALTIAGVPVSVPVNEMLP